jgi:hypothetical protein
MQSVERQIVSVLRSLNADQAAQVLNFAVFLRQSPAAVLSAWPINEDDAAMECALLSEDALSIDWDTPEEDEAWKHLKDLVAEG